MRVLKLFLSVPVLMSSAGLSLAEVDVANQRRIYAAMVEWYAAHCKIDDVSPLHVMMAATIANGSDPQLMEMVRDQLRERIDSRFQSTEPACASLRDSINKTLKK